MRKRVLAWILSVCVLVTGIPMEVLASENVELQELVSVGASASSTVTEEQLYMLAPSYLVNDSYDHIISLCGDLALEAIDSVSDTDEACAAYMHGLKQGGSMMWREFWSNLGLSDTAYKDFEEKAAMEVVEEYLGVSKNLTKTTKKVDEQLSFINKVYDLSSTVEKEKFKSVMMSNNSLLSQDEAGAMVDALFKQTDTIMKYAGDGSELFVYVMSLIEMQMIELQALDDLIIIHNQIKDTTMRDALAVVRSDISLNIGNYIISTYVKDKTLKWIQGKAKDYLAQFLPDSFKFS